MTYIAESLRQQVIARAKDCSEYCMIRQADVILSHEIDHIIPQKHRGVTEADNLCLSCFDCNRHKGSDFASFDPDTNDVTLLFHPRRDRWGEHFQIQNGEIIPLTAVGRVTVFLLDINDEIRVGDRLALMKVRRYPPD